MVTWAPNRIDTFVLGTDRALYHKWWNGATWGPSVTGYENIGGVCTSVPQALAWGPNRLDVFVTGTDSALYHKWWNGNAWGPSVTGFENMGGAMRRDPRAVSWGPDRLDVFVLGTDRALYHKWWDGLPGDPPSAATKTSAASWPARSGRMGTETGSMCSSSARTARCITSGGTAMRGAPP